MQRRADIAVYGPDGKLWLAVEVKSRPKRSAEWAARTLRNLLVHAAIPTAPYFLLVLPEAFYLWDNRDLALDQDPRLRDGGPAPDYSADAAVALGAYLDGTPFSLEKLSEPGLEMIAASWLTGVINSDLSKETAPPGLWWLFDSGLYDAIKGGSVATEAVI